MELKDLTETERRIVGELAALAVHFYDAGIVLPEGTVCTGRQMRELLAEAGSYRAPWDEAGEVQEDEDGEIIVRMVTCGTCGRRWNDALITSRTPAPAARCPFEYEHRS